VFGRVCLFVCSSFVRSLVRYACSMSRNPTFIKFAADVQHSCHISQLTFQRSRSKFKVKSAALKIVYL